MATLDHIKIFNQKENLHMKRFTKQLCLLLACLLCLSASFFGCGEEEVAELEITERYIRVLEREICAAPHLWLWSHRRWKHKKEA